jgi:hypothetical protein
MGKPFTIVSRKLISEPSRRPLDEMVKGVPKLLCKGFGLAFLEKQKITILKKIKLC